MEDRLFDEFYAALVYDDIEDYEPVIGSLTACIEANPANAAAHNNRAVAYWEIGQRELALADFKAAVALAPGIAQAWKNFGRFLEWTEDLPGALAMFDTAIAIDPDNPYMRRTRAAARYSARELSGALEDFNRAIEAEPEFAHAYVARAEVYEKLRMNDLAVADRMTATKLFNTDNDARRARLPIL